MKVIRIAGMLVAVVMIIFGLAYAVPEKEVAVKGYQDKGWANGTGIEYVGGDAYNYQIEASLKAGYYAGVMTMKTGSVVGGILLLFLSSFSLARMQEADTHARVTVQAMAEYLAQNREVEYHLVETTEEIIRRMPPVPEKTAE